MKIILTNLFLMMVYLCVGQNVSYKSNLFDNTDISIDVTKKSDRYILEIHSDSITKDSIYEWDELLVKSVFNKRFTEQPDVNNIGSEANKLFYEYKIQEIVANYKNKQPSAGVIGFENETVYLFKGQEIEKQYIVDLKMAKKCHRKYDSLTYKNFNIINRKGIIDTILSADRIYTKKELKKEGPDATKESLRLIVGGKYEAYLNELSQMKEDSLKLLEKQQNFKGVKANFDYYQAVLDSINRMQSISISDKNYLGVYIYQTKQNVEEKLKSYPEDTVLIGFSRLLNKIEMWNVQATVGQVFADRQKVIYIDSSTAKVEALIKAKQPELEIGRMKIETDIIANSIQQLTLKKQLNSMAKELEFYKDYLLKLEIDSVKVEITKTFIENLLVYGHLIYYDFQESSLGHTAQRHVTLRNTFPIGISTLNAIDYNIKSVQLYAMVNAEKYEAPLCDVMAFYRPEIASKRRDLSPADTTITVVKDASTQTSELKREATGELFEFKVFSDFVGLDGTNSNGLIQTEFSKELYLNPYRYLFSENQNHSAYWSIGAYIAPSFTWSKIENNNKYYSLIRSESEVYIPTLALQQYEIFNVGFDCNLFMIAFPFLKSNLYFDPGVFFGRSGVADSVYSTNDTVRYVNAQGVDNLTLRANARFVIQTDERYFFEIRGFYQYTNLLNNSIIQSPSADLLYGANTSEKSMLGGELFAGFLPNGNSDGKLFFRYRYTYSLGSKDGFNQVQLGYAYYFKKK